jgi:hypothetical protein
MISKKLKVASQAKTCLQVKLLKSNCEKMLDGQLQGKRYTTSKYQTAMKSSLIIQLVDLQR